ncbi:hypothetical protein [Scleromatobacter humisilvae]|uniref:Uncharacterized protein n=1 Tax=Scleromatobacter humisilvae TaxID=2897159 RepID=A0A9X1YFA3_9BURK|nr:hypothetical protein [Scleromatobacter humisilvae]MCK9684983.1 hypothetical protein [Scleromatobacter humisilvae]
MFYLFVLASSILCAASTAFATQTTNLGQGDIALAARDAGGVSEIPRSNAPNVANDVAIDFASLLTSASRL